MPVLFLVLIPFPSFASKSTGVRGAGTANKVSRATPGLLARDGLPRGTAYFVSRAGSATEVCLGMRCRGFRQRARSFEINAG